MPTQNGQRLLNSDLDRVLTNLVEARPPGVPLDDALASVLTEAASWHLAALNRNPGISGDLERIEVEALQVYYTQLGVRVPPVAVVTDVQPSAELSADWANRYVQELTIQAERQMDQWRLARWDRPQPVRASETPVAGVRRDRGGPPRVAEQLFVTIDDLSGTARARSDDVNDRRMAIQAIEDQIPVTTPDGNFPDDERTVADMHRFAGAAYHRLMAGIDGRPPTDEERRAAQYINTVVRRDIDEQAHPHLDVPDFMSRRGRARRLDDDLQLDDRGGPLSSPAPAPARRLSFREIDGLIPRETRQTGEGILALATLENVARAACQEERIWFTPGEPYHPNDWKEAVGVARDLLETGPLEPGQSRDLNLAAVKILNPLPGAIDEAASRPAVISQSEVDL